MLAVNPTTWQPYPTPKFILALSGPRRLRGLSRLFAQRAWLEGRKQARFSSRRISTAEGGNFVCTKELSCAGPRQHKVAAAFLIETISFDKNKKQLVKTYNEGLHLVAPMDTLDLIGPKAVPAESQS
jgi:hypothetical protein